MRRGSSRLPAKIPAVVLEQVEGEQDLPFAAGQKFGRLLRCCGPHLLAASISVLDPQETSLHRSKGRNGGRHHSVTAGDIISL